MLLIHTHESDSLFLKAMLIFSALGSQLQITNDKLKTKGLNPGYLLEQLLLPCTCPLEWRTAGAVFCKQGEKNRFLPC